MKTSAIIPITVLALLLVGCNLPGVASSAGLSPEQQAATIVAATMNAQPAGATSIPATAVTPSSSPAVPSATATSKPTLKINTAGTECRTGPGGDATVVATFNAGTTLDLVGKDNVDSFWVVVDPISHNLCWVQGGDGTPGGSYQTVVEVTPPASSSSSPKAPARPPFVRYSFECTFATGGSQLNVDLSWTDQADNESGYYIYRDGSQIADLPANSTSYSDTTTAASGHTYVYGVAAYNDVGISDQAVTKGDSITCQ
ncbi:MAG TPA: hypothetical protein VMJ64_08695 [Anaerolineales bacterium]|nr:hypothetical protein [Anaerolineales bacterium]